MRLWSNLVTRVKSSPDANQVPVDSEERSIYDQAVRFWRLGVHPNIGGMRLRCEIAEDQTPTLQPLDHDSLRRNVAVGLTVLHAVNLRKVTTLDA
jgi:hypothetical protein